MEKTLAEITGAQPYLTSMQLITSQLTDIIGRPSSEESAKMVTDRTNLLIHYCLKLDTAMKGCYPDKNVPPQDDVKIEYMPIESKNKMICSSCHKLPTLELSLYKIGTDPIFCASCQALHYGKNLGNAIAKSGGFTTHAVHESKFSL